MYLVAVGGRLWASRWSASIFEAVAEFAVDLAGVVVVEAAEGEAVVEQDAAVGDVGGGDGGGEFFAEALAEGEIEGGVLGKVGVGVAGSWWAVGVVAPLVKPEP